MISKKILIPIVVLTIVSAAVIGAGSINAQTTNEPFSGLVDTIAQKFGLDKSKVQSTVDEYREKHQQERQQMMQQKIEDKLSQYVKDGKITETQKQAILKKHQELRNKFNPETMRNMTQDERKKAMDEKQAEIKSWAEAQGIDPNYFMFGFGRGGMHKQGWAKP